MGTKAGEQNATAAEVAQAEYALNQFRDYQKRWVPVQQKLASVVTEQGAPGSDARTRAAGRAGTDVAASFEQAGGAMEKQLAGMGAAPSSSKAKLAVAGMGDDQATATASGKLMTDQQLDDAYTQNLSALMALGRGERAMATRGITNAATTSAAQAQSDARTSLMERSGNAQMIGQLAGFGLQQGIGSLGKGGGMGTVTSSTPMQNLNPGGMYGTPQAGP